MDILFISIGLLAISIIGFFAFCLITVLVSSKNMWKPIYEDELLKVKSRKNRLRNCRVVKMPAKAVGGE